MSVAEVQLRTAHSGDAYALWLWANDGQTRKASFGRACIPWPEHRSWLDAALSSEDCVLLVAELKENQPIGSVRFNSADDWRTARLSYVLAPEARGLGLSRELVERGVGYLRVRHPDARIWADVVADNEQSLRVFRGAGWREDATDSGSRFWSSTSETVE